MSRIFLSHSSADSRQALALKRWLVQQDPPLANEIFLDLDQRSGIRAGVRWKDALRHANTRCEAVICLLSPNWASSDECRTEYRTAENLNKMIFCARLEPSTADDKTAEWQRCDLFGGGPTIEVDLDDGEPIAFQSEGLYRLRDGIRGAGIGADSFVWPPPGDPDRVPYRGWESLEDVDAAVFFGRDAPIIRGLDALRRMRTAGVETMFVVLGPSGVGKSSFLRAGLVPRLRRDDRNYLLLDIVRPERNVLTGEAGLAHAIHKTRNRLGLTAPRLGEIKKLCLGADVARIRELLVEAQQTAGARLLNQASGSPPPTLVVPVDQAEELFTADAGVQAPRFLDTIAELAAAARGSQWGLIVALTIRTDRYQALQTARQLGGVGSVVFDELKPMPRTQFKEVITGPAARATQAGRPLEVEPALVNRLLDDCTEGADTLPLLALTLARLYEDYGSAGALTLPDYEAMGGLQHVVQTEIDALLATEPAQRRIELDLLRAAFIPWLATINPDNDQPTRRQALWRDLPEDSRPLLDRFVAKRLLIKDERAGAVIVEVALESLLRQWDDLAGWLAEERADLKAADTLERFAAEWENKHRDDAGLLRASRLVDAETLAAKPGFHERLLPTSAFLAASRQRENEFAEAARRKQEEELQAAKQLAAAETSAKEHAEARANEAQTHAVVLRKRSRVLRAVLAATVIVAIAAVVGLGYAIDERHQAAARTRETVALKLTFQGQAILAGVQGGGAVRALQEILAAPHIAPSADDTGALFTELVALRDTVKIIPTSGSVLGVAFSPDGRRIVSGSTDDTLRLWNAETGQPLGAPLTGHTQAVSGVAFSPDGRRVVSGSDDDTLRLWNAETGQPLGAPLTGHTDEVNSVAFSPDGHRIVSGSDDDTLRLWNADTGQSLGPPLTGHNGAVNSVAFSPDGQRIVSGSTDDTLRLWNVDTGQPIGDPFTGHTAEVWSVAFSPDGRRVVSGSADHTLRRWNVDTGQQIGAPLTGHTDRVYRVAVSPDGHRIVSGSADETLRLWDADTGQPLGAPLAGHQGAVYGLAFGFGGHRIVSGSADHTLRLWDPEAGQPLTGHTGEVTSVAYGPDGHRIASSSAEDTLWLWNPDTGRPLGPPIHADGVTSLAFSPDGHRIVSGNLDDTVRLWNADTGQQIGGPLKGHTDAVTSVAFSSDGHRIVSGSEDETVRLWDADTGREVGQPLIGHRASVWSVAFGPGHRIVSGSADHTLRLWDADTGQPIGAPLAGHNSAVNSVAFSPDGHRVVSGSADTNLRLWNADTGQSIGDPLTGHTAEVWSVAFSPDGHRVVSGSNDNTLRLWDADTGQPIGAPLTGHTDHVSSVAFSPDGHRIVSGSEDDTVRLWPTPDQAAWPELLCSKLTVNMGRRQWAQLVSPHIHYTALCPDLPIAPDNPG